MKVWVGCSGFHYKHWINSFYPSDLPQKKWFDFYNQHFNTFELNVTFYRFPRLSVLESWHERSSSGFKFSVKCPKAITHFKQFNDCKRMIDDFYGTTREGLKDKLGAVLFQLPPRTKYTEERLERIVINLDNSFSNVLEFRHTSWWNPEVYATLTKHNITFCGMSHPDYSNEPIQNASTFYYRFHGVPELYKSPYSITELQEFADSIWQLGENTVAYIYFNNDIDASAINNAKQLNEIFKSKNLT